jgi:tetratricopeptide (TPR) repeat protein
MHQNADTSARRFRPLHIDRRHAPDDGQRHLQVIVPGSPEAYETSDQLATEARELEAAGQLSRAREKLVRAAELTPERADLLIGVALIARKLAQPLDAEEALLAALSIAPDHPTAMFTLALVYEDLGIWERAVRWWVRLTELDPNGPQPHFQAGVCFGLHLKQFDRAFRAFKPLPNVLDGYWLKLITEIQQERDRARARVHATLRARRGGGTIEGETGVVLARDLLHLGRPRTAQGILDRVRDGIDPMVALTLQFEIDWRVLGLEHAVDNLEPHIDFAEPPAAIRFTLADALYQIGDYERSAAVWRRIDLAGIAPHEREMFWRASFAARNFTEALQIGETCLALSPYDTKGGQFVLSTLLAQGSLEPTNSPAEGAAANRMLIPPVLFRFWDKPVPPEDVQAVLGSWDGPAEGLRDVLFDETAARAFITETYPDRYLAAYDACHHPAMKSDFLRLCYLTERGGIYLDVDQARVPGGPSLRQSLAGRSLVLPLSATGPVYTNNNIIAAVPGHPVLRMALEEALVRIEEATRQGIRLDLWATTGPGVFTRTLVRYLLARMRNEETGAEGGEIALFSDQYLNSITALVNDLAYKRTVEGNWRLI